MTSTGTLHNHEAADERWVRSFVATVRSGSERSRPGILLGMRSTKERRDDALTRLKTDRNVWVATAGDAGAHLVPLSLCWYDDAILLSTRADRPLAQNIIASCQARVGLGDGDDVVLIDAKACSTNWSDAHPMARRAFAERTGWDPGEQSGSWVLLCLEPQTVRVWRTVAENLQGSMVMKDGSWLC